MAEVVIKDVGVADYKGCLDMQLGLLAKRQNGEIENTVLLVEHPDVITLGARGEKNIVKDAADVEVVNLRRGGGATAHNPGQIVVYPIVDLKSLSLGVNEYVRTLESIGIELLASFGLECERKKGLPGLWVGEKKVASIGVKIKKWVTYHGLAINIFNDLSIFDKIVPCGIADVEMTSLLKETGEKVEMSEVKEVLRKILESHFLIAD